MRRDGLFKGSYQFFDVVFHDVLAAANAVRILFDGQLLGRALEALRYELTHRAASLSCSV